MSISHKGVKIKKRGNVLWLAILGIVEVVFTVLLIISLSSNFLFPRQVSAVAGVSAKLSYQGRLTDLTGTALGGTSGTNYCFRFSIYDAVSGGSKVWPTGTPNSTTVRVKDGVFNSDLGTADSLSSFDFSSNDTLYLQVDIYSVPTTCTGGSWESLDVRQRIDAVAYARTAEGVYSSLLRAPTGGTVVQIGLGSGSNPPIYLGLDQKNVDDTVGASCTNNGQMWYTASTKNRFRVCQGSTIRDMVDGILVRDEGVDKGRASTALDFTGAGVSASKGAGGVININIPFGGVAVNAAGTVSSGVIVFSNSNNVTFGLNGSTVTASASYVAGGGGYAINDFVNFNRAYIINVTNMTATGVTQRPIFIPFILPGSLTWNMGAIEVSRATSGSNLFTADFGIYSFVNSTQIGLMGSLQNTYSGTNTGSISGIRRIIFTGMGAGATVLTPGHYVMGMKFSASAGTASMNYSLRGAVLTPPVGQVYPGANSNMTASSALSSIPMMMFLGRYTTTSGGLPNSVNFNQVQQYTSMYPLYFHLFST